MTFEQASERAFAESAIVKTARLTHPNVPEEILHALFCGGFSMGMLHGFTQAQGTIEGALMEYARGAVN